jgi:two-component system sensor histidine kinase HydH
VLSGYGRWVRWVLLGMTLAIGVVLTSTLWISYRSVERAAAVITDSQGKALIHATHNALHRAGRDAGNALAGLLEQEQAAGMRYVALLGEDGSVLAEAGELLDGARESDLRLRPLRFDTPIQIGADRLRIFDQRPSLRREDGADPDGAPPPRPLREHAQGPRGARPPIQWSYLMTEYEPLLANDLRREAKRTLVVGAGAALGLLIAALVSLRVLRQRDALEVRLERDRRLTALGEMSAVLAHEIRNPLASLKGHAQLLLEALPEDGKEHKKADRVVREARRLEALSTDLLDFVRAGQVERRAVDPSALLIESVDAVDPSRLDVDLDAAPESWSLDPQKMQQVLVNLLDNALKASEGGKPPRATISVEEDRLTIEVRDFGEGLPPGEEERIFEPFHTRRARGTGLGLAVARRIVELHRGALVAKNHPEGGALFRLSIPRG